MGRLLRPRSWLTIAVALLAALACLILLRHWY
jgi:hypothetical protein